MEVLTVNNNVYIVITYINYDYGNRNDNNLSWRNKMANFPYLTNAAKIKPFLDHIQDAKVPAKITNNYLLSAGFKSSNDRLLIPVMKFIGFLDNSGMATDKWRNYRNKMNSEIVLGEAIKAGYSDLYSMYEDAHSKDNETLRSYFSINTNVGKSTIDYIVTTFKTLCKYANFESIPIAETKVMPEIISTQKERNSKDVRISPSLQLNIEIHISADTTDDKIETIFKNMRKYLLVNE